MRRPRRAGIEAHRGAAVIPVNHGLVVLRVDPEVVSIPMRHPDHGEGLPAIDRAVHHHVVDIDRVGIDRVREDMRVVPSALDEVPVLINVLGVDLVFTMVSTTYRHTDVGM